MRIGADLPRRGLCFCSARMSCLTGRAKSSCDLAFNQGLFAVPPLGGFFCVPCSADKLRPHEGGNTTESKRKNRASSSLECEPAWLSGHQDLMLLSRLWPPFPEFPAADGRSNTRSRSRCSQSRARQEMAPDSAS